MYTSLTLRVKWGHTVSNCFTVRNGVKEGGVLSPLLYAIYTDSPLKRLERVRCKMSHGWTFHRSTLRKTQSPFSLRPPYPPNIHTANIIFTNIILVADKHNIPMGKMHSNCRLLPEDIVCKITQRKNIRRANTCDPALKHLNEEITSDIKKHKQTIWKEHLDAHWNHRHNAHHSLESNRAPPTTLNNSQTLSNTQHTKQTDPLTEQHKTYKDTISH